MIKLNSKEYTNSLISIGNILTSLGQITSLLLSKDGRLITGSSDGIIQIINITNYLIDISITASSIGGVYNLSQLDNGHIVAVNYDKSCLNFWSIAKDTYEFEFSISLENQNNIHKCLALSNNLGNQW